jgi:hypothetical protein
MKTPALLLALACYGAAIAADDNTIVPDRPGLVESSQVVGPGRWQLETGYNVERDHGERFATTPLLLRAGVGEVLEFRVETDGWSRLRAAGERQSGFADTSLGVKWHVADPRGAQPSMAILAHADLATGSRAFRGQGTRPSLRLTAEWDLPDNFSMGVIGGVARDSDDNGAKYSAGVLGVTAGFAASDKLHLYTELAGARLAKAVHGGNDVSVGAGATWLLSPDWQADFGVNKGISRQSANTALTAGLSTRF